MSYPWGSTEARIHQFSTFGCLTCKGLLKLAFINLWPLDVLPARVHPSYHQFSTFGCLAPEGPPKVTFINFRPLDVLSARVHQSLHLSLVSHPWLLDPHGSTFSDLFNYEDGRHTAIATNLKENVYDLIWRLLTLRGLTCWHCPKFKEDVGNLKEEVKPLLLPNWIMSLLPPT